MSRLVLDTNVLVSATLSTGPPNVLVLRCLAGAARILLSESTFDELAGTLRRSKFGLSDWLLVAYLRRLLEESEVSQPPRFPQAVAVDSDDDRFLELAIHGSADVIVSGDRDLLELGSFRGIPILTPKEALEWLDHGH